MLSSVVADEASLRANCRRLSSMAMLQLAVANTHSNGAEASPIKLNGDASAHWSRRFSFIVDDLASRWQCFRSPITTIQLHWGWMAMILKENLVLYPIQNSQRKWHSWIYFIMIDNMHYVILRIWEQDRVPWCGKIQNKRLEVLGNTFNLHSNSTFCPRSVVSQSVSKGE